MTPFVYSSILVSVIIAIGLGALYTWNSSMALKNLETSNPIYEHASVKDMVYQKPHQTSSGAVYGVFAKLSVVDMAKQIYELLVVEDFGGAKTLRDVLGTGEARTVMILQSMFTATYKKDIIVDGKKYNMYELKCDNMLDARMFSQLEFNTLANLHIFLT